MLLAGRNTLRWLRRQPTQPGDVVIAYQGGAYFLSCLYRWCRDRNVRMVVDITEWYSPRQLPGGRLSPAWWNSEISMRLICPAIGRMIVISSYLEQYYEARGCAVLRVPPLVDVQDPKWDTTGRITPEPSPLRLAYAGTPGRKDLLVNVFRGLAILRAQNVPVVFNLIGPTLEYLMETIPESAQWLAQLGEQVIFDGRVHQSEVPRRLMQSHFTVLLRPDKRYTRAGFPTKVVESLSAGVPVITNSTSDLSLCIQDGREGILLDDESPESFASGIRRLVALGPRAWHTMGLAARRRAESAFDYRTYIEPIRHFIFEAGHDSNGLT
jgi:glycosyltransferase involved in cell wall biosynthesis